jgi:NhaP-type Na+/H+ or K+/H+ antiporter
MDRDELILIIGLGFIVLACFLMSPVLGFFAVGGILTTVGLGLLRGPEGAPPPPPPRGGAPPPPPPPPCRG